jgi:hypothetical protein
LELSTTSKKSSSSSFLGSSMLESYFLLCR